VAQEQVTKAFVLMSALYDARKISNRERLRIIEPLSRQA
jgi:hypothetical protein